MKRSYAVLLLLSFMRAVTFAQTPLKNFTPGAIWPDNNGVHI